MSRAPLLLVLRGFCCRCCILGSVYVVVVVAPPPPPLLLLLLRIVALPLTLLLLLLLLRFLKYATPQPLTATRWLVWLRGKSRGSITPRPCCTAAL